MNDRPHISEAVQKRLAAILGSAASPHERYMADWLEPVAVEDDAAEREEIARLEQEWAHLAADGERLHLLQLLEARGIPEAEMCCLLRNVRLRDVRQLPAWAELLYEMAASFALPVDPVPSFSIGELSGGVAVPTGVNPAADWDYHAAFEPFLRSTAVALKGWTIASRMEIDTAVERHLLAQLARRWSYVCIQVFLADLSIIDVLTACPKAAADTVFASYLGNAEVTLEQWLDLWTAFPVLARLMAVVELHWRRSTAELIEHLSSDAALLAETFSPDRPLGSLARFEGDAGDTHDAGRSVAVLTFSSGAKVIHKPKQLQIASFYLELIQILNRSAPAAALATRKLVTRDAYTWEEFVAEEPCRSVAQVRRFYRRIGMHARLLQLLDAIDFHHENVLAAGEQPALIDLETILSPRTHSRASSSLTRRMIQEQLWDTPVSSGLLSCKTRGEPGRRSVELSAICAPGGRRAPYKSLTFRPGAEGGVGLAWDYSDFKVRSATPVLEGKPVDMLDYLAEIIDGYRTMTEQLRSCAPQLLADGGPLTSVADAHVRYVFCESQVYARLLTASLSPRFMRDGRERELYLERLWQGHLDPEPSAVEMVQAEIDALRDGDIPLFGSQPGTDAVFIGTGRRLAGYFNGTALGRVSERLRQLMRDPATVDADLVSTALFINAPEAPAPRTSNALGRHSLSARRFGVPASADRFLRAAVAVGDFILSKSVSCAHDEIEWLGLSFEPQYDLWQLGVLTDDILSGTSGLASVFADLGDVSGLSRFGDAATCILSANLGRGERQVTENTVQAYGAFVGIGGSIYAARRTGLALKNQSLRTRATALAESSRAGVLRAPVDLITGRAGMILSLLAGAECTTNTARLAACLADGLVNFTRQHDWVSRLPYLPDALPLRSLPGPLAGLMLSLMRLASMSTAAEFRPLSKDIEAILWRPVTGDPHDEGGHLLACLGAVWYEPSLAGRALEEADKYLTVRPHSSRAILESAEVAITAYQLTGERRFYVEAQNCGTALLEKYRATASWFPESLAADRFNLSAITGLGGVAHLFLKLHAPKVVASLRLLH